MLSYLFWPNPGNAYYDSRSMVILLTVSAALIIVSFLIRFWRKKLQNPITKKLSKTWAGASLWFGIVGIVLVVSRVEQIQFLAMRFMWVLWALAAAAFVFIQVRLFRARHYEVLPSAVVSDPRDMYLPGKRRK